MMFKAEVTIDTELLDKIARAKYPKLMETASKRAISRFRSRLLPVLRAEPGPSKRPVRWTSPAQRRYVFSQVLKRRKDGSIIPYQRTGRYAASWDITYDVQGENAILAITNSATTAKGEPLQQYVQGTRQQGFHKDTGWVNTDTILEDAMKEAEYILTETWFTVVDGVINS